MAENDNKKIRPPVVVVLGHVDHGKTKLLDTIRKTKVAEKESGGITQHIGAYQAEVNGKLITFLDTPGHEAFSAIRSRGVKVADIAILVVAADESIKPQTKEAIRIIKEEQIPFVVAINKIDKEGSNPQKVKQDLAGEEVLVEDWGGKVPAIEISAKEDKNIQELLDMILLLAELEELKEDTSLPAKGVIIESHLDKRRGYVATTLVQKGVIRLGDWIVAGTVRAKVKSMEDFAGVTISEAFPSQPVSVTGWMSAPEIGRSFESVSSKDDAERMSEDNVNLAPLFSFIKTPAQVSTDISKKILNLVVKSDVSSSLEAIDSALGAIKSDEVSYSVINYDIGNISESDLNTAISSKAEVVGFRVSVDDSAKKIAEKESVKVETFDIIYNLIEYVRKEMSELLEPEVRRTLLGRLRVLALFKKDAKSQIIGGKVVSGKIVRGGAVDVLRNNNKVLSCKLGQLQHNKEDVQEVKEGLEAGLRVDYLPGQAGEVKEGDTLEFYQEDIIKRSL